MTNGQPLLKGHLVQTRDGRVTTMADLALEFLRLTDPTWEYRAAHGAEAAATMEALGR